MYSTPPTLLLSHQAYTSRLQAKQKCKDDTSGLLGTAGILAVVGIRHSLFVKTENVLFLPDICLAGRCDRERQLCDH